MMLQEPALGMLAQHWGLLKLLRLHLGCRGLLCGWAVLGDAGGAEAVLRFLAMLLVGVD